MKIRIGDIITGIGEWGKGPEFIGVVYYIGPKGPPIPKEEDKFYYYTMADGKKQFAMSNQITGVHRND